MLELEILLKKQLRALLKTFPGVADKPTASSVHRIDLCAFAIIPFVNSERNKYSERRKNSAT